MPDDDVDAVHLRGQLIEQVFGPPHEARTQQQILRWIAGQGQFREENQIGTVMIARLLDRLENPVPISGDMPDKKVVLGQCDLQHSMRSCSSL
jgi:hypothetical protein